MKFKFWKQFLPSVVLSLVLGGLANADVVVIDFSQGGVSDGQGGQLQSTGDILNEDRGNFINDNSPPTPFDVAEDTTLGLEVILSAITGNNGNDAEINPAPSTFSIFTPDDGNIQDALNFNGDESIGVSFNFDVFIEEVNLGGIDTGDSFFIGTQEVNSGNSDVSDDFDFTADGSEGLILRTGDTLTLSAGTGNVSLVGITVNVVPEGIPAVPEPSSVALLGLLGLGVVARRRR